MAARAPITVVVRRFQRLGGSEGQACALVAWLAQAGVPTRVICERAGRGAPRGPGIEVLRLPSRALGRWAFSLAVAAVPRRPGEVRFAFDRVLGCEITRAGGGAHAAWLAAREALDGGRRASVAERMEGARERLALRSARLVWANSDMGADDLRAAYGADLPPVETVRNAVELADIAPPAREALRASWGVPRAGRVAIFLGSGFARKGLDTAVRAFLWASSQHDRLVVVGDDRESGWWERRARARLGSRLLWVGPHPEARALLAGADALLLPTHYDPSSNAVFEALAAGVPPVGSARDGAMEVVDEARLRGLVPGESSGFARALSYAWEDGREPGRWREVAAAWPASRMGASAMALAERARGEARDEG